MEEDKEIGTRVLRRVLAVWWLSLAATAITAESCGGAFALSLLMAVTSGMCLVWRGHFAHASEEDHSVR